MTWSAGILPACGWYAGILGVGFQVVGFQGAQVVTWSAGILPACDWSAGPIACTVIGPLTL